MHDVFHDQPHAVEDLGVGGRSTRLVCCECLHLSLCLKVKLNSGDIREMTRDKLVAK